MTPREDWNLCIVDICAFQRKIKPKTELIIPFKELLLKQQKKIFFPCKNFTSQKSNKF